MGLQDEYAAIAEGMRLGTLKPARHPEPPKTWMDKRYTHSHMSTHGPGLAPGFGEQVDSALKSSVAYSFGNFSRKDGHMIFISKELSKGESISPGPVRSSAGPAGTWLLSLQSSRFPNFNLALCSSCSLHIQSRLVLDRRGRRRPSPSVHRCLALAPTLLTSCTGQPMSCAR